MKYEHLRKQAVNMHKHQVSLRTADPNNENAENIMLFGYVVILVTVAYRFKG